jgi:hypothetical protein
MLASVFFMETPVCNAAAVAASTAFADDYSEIYVPLDVACKLERERDEAIAITKEAITGLYNLGDYDLANQLSGKLEELK